MKKQAFSQSNQNAYINHASGLTAAAKIRTIEFQNQQAVSIRSLVF